MTMTEPLQDVDEEMAPQAWRAVLVIEGEVTSDGRFFDALTWREPPLTLRGEPNLEEHDGGAPIGRIDRIERDGNRIIGEGVFDISPAAIEVVRLVKAGMVKGVSIDAAVQEMSVDDDGIAHFDAEIIAATIVQMPAFADAVIELVHAPMSAEVEDTVETADMPMPDMPPKKKKKKMPMDPMMSVVEDWGHGLALVASGAVSDIPAEWFDDPHLTRRERLHVESDGRVWGHVYGWGECHTGSMPGSCVQVPRDIGLDYFNLGGGAVMCANGAEICTGPLVLSADHAKVRGISWLQAKDHYAHTGLAVADVLAGTDSHGIWVAGAVRPGTQAEMLHALRASRPSVDCRVIGGRWQLLALLSVNMPGYPALVAGIENGRVTALVASGQMQGGDCGCGSHEALSDLQDRLGRLEARYRADQAEAIAALEIDLGLDRASLAAQLEAELALT